MVPCLVREDMTMAEVDGQWRTYCHKECQWTDQTAFRPTYQPETPNMGQLIGKREWETLYHGLDWANVVKDMGYVPKRQGEHDGRAAAPEPGSREDVDAGPSAQMGPVLSPNVLLNEMTPEQREAFQADYNRQGPAGRPAPAAS